VQTAGDGDLPLTMIGVAWKRGEAARIFDRVVGCGAADARKRGAEKRLHTT